MIGWCWLAGAAAIAGVAAPVLAQGQGGFAYSDPPPKYYGTPPLQWQGDVYQPRQGNPPRPYYWSTQPWHPPMPSKEVKP